MESYDVAVIGAGPAGSTAALHSAKTGARTILLESDPRIGFPVQCAGLLGIKAWKEADLYDGDKCRIKPFSGASIYSPGGQKLSFKADSTKAWLVDRRRFDRSLAIKSIKNGVELRLNCYVSKICGKNPTTIVLRDETTIKAKVVISAEGFGARIARLEGIPPPKEVLSGAQVEAPYQVEDEECVELHLGVSPGLFAWVIPLSSGSARIGLCTRENACARLKEFLRSPNIKDKLAGSRTALNLGGLPLGIPSKTVACGFIAVGDAASQVKPTSGGGIYPGIICARIGGEVAAKAALENDVSSKRLLEYEKRWRKEIGLELQIGMKLHGILDSMSHEELDHMIGYMANKEDLIRLIEEHGDIDRPSTIAGKMLRHLDASGLWIGGKMALALVKRGL